MFTLIMPLDFGSSCEQFDPHIEGRKRKIIIDVMEAVLRNHILENENFKNKKKIQIFTRKPNTKEKNKKKFPRIYDKKLHKKLHFVLNVENIDTQQNIVK